MIATVPQQQSGFSVKALAWTIGVHALLLLLFLLFRYSVQPVQPDVTGDGLEVNLGTSETGSGNDQPMSTESPSAYAATVVYHTAAAKSDLPKDMLRTQDAAAPDVNNPTGKKNTGHPGEDSKANTPPQPKFLYPGETGKGGNSAATNAKGSNEGISGGQGDQGVPGGTPGASNYTGAPGTGGIGHTLTGRTITPAKFEAEFREGGKVVIHVTVNRDGNIVNKFVKSSSSAQLTKIALDKLSRAKFSPSTGTEPQQFGDVTIIFKAR